METVMLADLDIVCPGKTGLYLLENLLK